MIVFEIGENLSKLLVYMGWLYILSLVFKASINLVFLYIRRPDESFQHIENVHRIVEEEEDYDEEGLV